MEIRLEGLCKAYEGKAVLQNLNHVFPGGRTSCILGPSGCGKTTLLRLLAGLEKPDSGSIIGLDGLQIRMVFQENRLLENLSAEKNVLLTARPGFNRKDAEQLLASLGLDIPAQKAATLSGGMQRRTAISRALAAQYDVLLLDEPLTGLDGETRRMVLSAIQKMTAGKTVIWVTHQADDACRLGAEILDFSRTSG